VVAAGDALLAPRVTRRLIAEFTRRPELRPRPAAALEEITGRELVIAAYDAGLVAAAERAPR
jgi:hypothetical protein